ncbi:MAG: hypothetical protein QOK43_3177 [Acidimicrobiaceae bacterium]|nr:hypothetical protein [Acidimicrobiaceae bacterium]
MAAANKKAARPGGRAGPGGPDGPHGRLGLAWAVATAAVVLAGPVPAGVWMAVHAGLACVQVERSWATSARTTLAAAAGAALFAFACAFGLIGAAVGAAVAASAAAVTTAGEGALRPRTVGTAVWLGAAAGSLVLARTMGAVPGLFLLGLVCAYDTGNYLVGTGAQNAWEGPAAGIAALGPVTVTAATIAVPPFVEVGPWLLGALAAVLTPLGEYAGSTLLGRGQGKTNSKTKTRSKKARVPALRRLDALLVVGPLWVAAAELLRS